AEIHVGIGRGCREGCAHRAGERPSRRDPRVLESRRRSRCSSHAASDPAAYARSPASSAEGLKRSVPEVVIGDVNIAYDVAGEGEPIVLVCGCGQPAVGWQLQIVPGLVAAGYQVLTFDNRGVAPSSSPPAPYSIDDMVGDTLG